MSYYQSTAGVGAMDLSIGPQISESVREAVREGGAIQAEPAAPQPRPGPTPQEVGRTLRQWVTNPEGMVDVTKIPGREAWLFDPSHPDHKPIFDMLAEKNVSVDDLRQRGLTGAVPRQYKGQPVPDSAVVLTREGILFVADVLEGTRKVGTPVAPRQGAPAGPREEAPWYRQQWGPLPAWGWLAGGAALLLGVGMLRR